MLLPCGFSGYLPPQNLVHVRLLNRSTRYLPDVLSKSMLARYFQRFGTVARVVLRDSYALVGFVNPVSAEVAKAVRFHDVYECRVLASPYISRYTRTRPDAGSEYMMNTGFTAPGGLAMNPGGGLAMNPGGGLAMNPVTTPDDLCAAVGQLRVTPAFAPDAAPTAPLKPSNKLLVEDVSHSPAKALDFSCAEPTTAKPVVCPTPRAPLTVHVAELLTRF